MICIPNELLELLEKENIKLARDADVASRSSFKIGGVAALAVFPDSREKLVSALRLLYSFGIRTEVIGNASNVLFAFDLFDGALVFTGDVSDHTVEGTRITASCGASLTRIARVAAENSLSGLEFAYGIPAQVGGAVFMNAGAYGSCVGEVIESSLAYDAKNDRVVKINDHGFDYRSSVYSRSEQLYCLEVTLLLKKGAREEIEDKMNANMRSRKDSQPLEYPSAGSYFKRPLGHFAGKLIEDAGLKGTSVGDAEVSTKHAGFIINRGNASFGDVLGLEQKIKEKIMSLYGVALEREVRLIK